MPRRKTNVLYFSDLAILGGGEVCMAALLRFLDRERYHPLVLVPERGPLLDELQGMGVDACAIRLFEGMRAWRIKRFVYAHVHARLRRNLGRIRRLVREGPIDLIHTHGGMYPQNVRHLGRLAREARIPVVWTCGYGGVYRRGIVEEYLAPWVDHVIAVSHSVKERLVGTGALEAERVSVLHHGLDIESWTPGKPDAEVRRQLGAGEGDVLFGMVGRVVRIKGHDTFLQAAARLAADLPRARFVVVGDQRPDEGTGGRYFRHLQQEAGRLGLGDRLLFAGWRTDVPAVMSAIDVLVQPSLEEAFGRTLLEAMALERPVVAARTGGMPEVIEEGRTGFLVTPGAPDELAAAMKRMTEDPDLRAAMGRAGRERVIERFNLEKRARLVEGIYRRMLNGPPESDRTSAPSFVAAGETT